MFTPFELPPAQRSGAPVAEEPSFALPSLWRPKISRFSMLNSSQREGQRKISGALEARPLPSMHELPREVFSDLKRLSINTVLPSTNWKGKE